MVYFVYNVFFTCFVIFSAPYFLIRSFLNKQFRKEWIQRVGFSPISDKRPIWVHAASVGEVFCTLPLLKRIKREFPDRHIVLTTMTRTGNEAAKAQIPEADTVFFFPMDHPFAIHRTIERIKPCLLLIAETELWPNFLRSCGSKGIPIVLFNGRISDKSFQRYLFLKFFFKQVLKYISLFLMQTEKDRNRIVQIGAASDKTKATGNIKFDQTVSANILEKIDEIRKSLGLQGNETILVAGSTHSGEEEILISLLKDLREMDPHLLLILAPRHLDRLEEVERILKKEFLSWKKKTSFPKNHDQSNQPLKELPHVILLDTMGELMSLYSLATLVFIGGSLVPVGGHNPLEPLFFKKCVLFGPYMFNFSEISNHLTEVGGAIQVKDKKDLMLQLKRLLSDGRARSEVGERGYQFLQRHQGTTERVFEEIKRFLINY